MPGWIFLLTAAIATAIVGQTSATHRGAQRRIDQKRRASALEGTPIPQPERTLLGHLPYALRGENGCAYNALVKLQNQLGNIFQLSVLGDDWICVADLDSIYKILVTERDKFPKAGAAIEEMKSVIGESGILVSEGKDWLRQRRMCIPAFRHEQMQNMVEAMNSVARRTLEQVSKSASIDALELLNRAAFAIICQAGFNYEVDAINHSSHDPMLEAQELAAIELVKRIQRTRYWKKLPLPSNFRLARLLVEQQQLLQKIISEQSEHETNARILLNDFIRARDDKGERLSETELLHMCQQLMAAGHETTGAAMQWTLYFLSQHPDWLYKIRTEADAILGERLYLQFEDIKRLQCFEQVFNEVMRLRPPFPILLRSVAKDTVLNGHFFPEGASLLLMIGAVQIDERYWGEQPEAFNPEHFSPENAAMREPNAYAPFGIGPRLCVGNRFTMMEAAMLLVPLLRTFEFELIEGQNVKPFLRTAWSTRSGIKFQVKKRQ